MELSMKNIFIVTFFMCTYLLTASLGGMIAMTYMNIEIKDIKYQYQQEIQSLEQQLENKLIGEEDLSLAIKNNNPLNIKANNWKGQIDIDKFGHAVFSQPELGIRAAAYVLINYYLKHNINTLSDLINRFCTGNQKEYIKYLSKRLNLKPDEPFDILQYLPDLLHAMARFESGKTWDYGYFIPYSMVTVAYNKGVNR